MAKWYGTIGFGFDVETDPGIHELRIEEREYAGDLNRNNRRLQSTDSPNDNINIANEISIVADPYADTNFFAMLYAEIKGTRWKISNVEVQYPRLILSLGGVYNG